MKKFLSVLLAVAMVMSLIPTMAFADAPEGLVKVTIVEPKDGGDRFQFKTGIEAAENDVIKIVINASGLKDGALSSSSQYIRGADRSDKWTATVRGLENGWVELTATAAGATAELAFTLYGGEYAKDEFIYVESITVGDTTYTFADQDDVDAVGFTEYSQPTDLSFELVTEGEDDAPAGLVKVTIVEPKDGGDRFQFKTGIEAAENDVIKIVINASGLKDGALSSSSQYIRGADRSDKWTATVRGLENGWVELTATAAGATAELAFTLYGGEYAKDEFIYVESITVGDTTYTFADQDDVDAVGFTEYSQPTDLSFELITETADQPVIWLGYTMPAKSSDRNTIFVESNFVTGDVVSFLVYIGDSSDVDNTDMYVRKSAKALYLGTNEEVYSGNHIVDFALPLLDEGEETGWYYIECVLQEDSTKLEFSVDGQNVSDGDLGQNLITCIAVNGELLDDTVVVTDNSGNPVTPEELDATGVELPEREALQLIVTGEGATVVVKDYEGTEVEPGEEALTEKYQYTVDVEVAEGYELLGILVNGEEFENGDSFIASESVEITVSTLQKFEADITAENATVVIKDADGNAIEGEIEFGTEVTLEIEVAEGYELVSVTVNGEAYEDGDTIIVTEGLEIEVITAEETTDVEPTGAISVAVVAIVAVIGGAVVLKKREF